MIISPLTLLISFVLGGFTNMFVEMKQNNGLVLPKKMKTKWKLGFISDFLLGGITGLLFVSFVEPDSLYKIISLSILGGFGGIATIERLYGNQIDEKQENIEEKLKKTLK